MSLVDMKANIKTFEKTIETCEDTARNLFKIRKDRYRQKGVF